MQRLVAAALAALIAAGTPYAVAAQSPTGRAPSWRLEVGLAGGARYSEEADGGPEVSSRLQPLLGASAAWGAGPRTLFALTARVSAGKVRVESGGGDWSGGTVADADLLAVLEWSPRPRVTLRGGAGAAWLRGSSELAPFRFNNDTPLHLGGLLGVSARVSRARPLDAFLDLQAVRYGGSELADPIAEPGTVSRLVLGVRHGL